MTKKEFENLKKGDTIFQPGFLDNGPEICEFKINSVASNGTFLLKDKLFDFFTTVLSQDNYRAYCTKRQEAVDKFKLKISAKLTALADKTKYYRKLLKEVK